MANEMGQAESALSRAADHVASAKADLDHMAREVECRVQGVAAAWTGQGGAAFQALGAAWAARQRTLNRALDRLEDALRATEHAHQATDEAQSATMARLRQRL